MVGTFVLNFIGKLFVYNILLGIVIGEAIEKSLFAKCVVVSLFSGLLYICITLIIKCIQELRESFKKKFKGLLLCLAPNKEELQELPLEEILQLPVARILPEIRVDSCESYSDYDSDGKLSIYQSRTSSTT